MTIKFDRNIEIPSRKGRSVTNPLLEMVSGNSKFFPFDPKRPLKDKKRITSMVSSARTKRAGFGWEFVTRTLEEEINGKMRKGIRVWRVS